MTVRPDETPEVAVARAKGIVLLGVIGSGEGARGGQSIGMKLSKAPAPACSLTAVLTSPQMRGPVPPLQARLGGCIEHSTGAALWQSRCWTFPTPTIGCAGRGCWRRAAPPNRNLCWGSRILRAILPAVYSAAPGYTPLACIAPSPNRLPYVHCRAGGGAGDA